MKKITRDLNKYFDGSEIWEPAVKELVKEENWSEIKKILAVYDDYREWERNWPWPLWTWLVHRPELMAKIRNYYKEI